MSLLNSQIFSNNTLQKDRFLQNLSEQNRLLSTHICRNFKEKGEERTVNQNKNQEINQKFQTIQCTQKFMRKFQEREVHPLNLQSKCLKQSLTFILFKTPNLLRLELVSTLHKCKLMTQLEKKKTMKKHFIFIIFLSRMIIIENG